MGRDLRVDQNSRNRNVLGLIKSSRSAKIGNTLTILVGIACAYWIWSKTPYNHNNLKKAPTTPPFHESMGNRGREADLSFFNAPWIFRNGFIGGGRNLDHRTDNFIPSPRPFPMYVANLDCKVDKYVVSAREVIGNSGRQRLNFNITPDHQREALSKLQISLQIMSSDDKALANVKDFGVHLSAVDDTGKRCDSVPSGNFPVVLFNSGRARIVALTTPSTAAKYLKEVTGDIILSSAVNGKSKNASTPVKSFPFVLHNIPLPVINHIYCDVDAALITHQPVPAGHFSMIKTSDRLQAKVVSTNMLGAFPDSRIPNGPLNLPTHLILQDGVRANYSFYVQSGRGQQEVRCSMLPHAKLNGEIQLDCDFTSSVDTMAKINKKYTAWLDEPNVLSIPADSLLGKMELSKRILIRMKFSMDSEGSVPLNPPQSVTAFQPVVGERGAVIEGSVEVRGNSRSYGSIKMIVQKLNPVKSQAERKYISVWLDRRGHFKLPNTAPGTYRLRIVGYEPILTPFVKYGGWDDYIRTRFSINHPVWDRESQEITLRAGGYSSLLPWNLVESKV